MLLKFPDVSGTHFLFARPFITYTGTETIKIKEGERAMGKGVGFANREDGTLCLVIEVEMLQSSRAHLRLCVPPECLRDV